MYQTMEIYMARKKQVPSHYNPDSNRIFDCTIGDDSLGNSRMNKLHINKKHSPPPPHPREPERRNCPHPWHSRFLRHNAKLLNEPICVMATENTDAEQSDWWPSRTSDEPLIKPSRTTNTTQRSDYQHSAPVKGNTRHSCNPFSVISKGIVPVNSPKREGDPGDVLLERTSYNHDYNSRLERNEPIRGKLHGSFVWDEVVETENGPVIVTPWNKKLLHRCVTVPVIKQDQKVVNAAPSDENSNQKSPREEAQENQPVNENGGTPNSGGSPKPTSPKSEEPINEAMDKTDTLPPIDGLPAPSA